MAEGPGPLSEIAPLVPASAVGPAVGEDVASLSPESVVGLAVGNDVAAPPQAIPRTAEKTAAVANHFVGSQINILE